VRGFGEELVSVAHQGLQIDVAGFDRPEAPPAGLVTQVGFLVCGADEEALPRLDHLHPSVAWPVALDGAGDERFQQRRFRAVHSVHLGDLDQPFATQMLGDVLTAAGNVREVIGEIGSAEYPAGG
jgi:hypothetical protein